MVSHAYLPTPLLLDERTIRVYVSFWDKSNVGRIGYVDVDSRDPSNVKGISQVPVLDIGRNGCFDDNGVNPSSIVQLDDRIYLYYVGFQLMTKIPYTMFAGLAISEDGGDTFHRLSSVPILDRTDDEQFFRTAPFVLHHEGKWKMWYVGGSEWIKRGNRILPAYTVKYIESNDGIHWPRKSITCFGFSNEDEHGFGRPFVFIDRGVYKMIFSIRTKSGGYRNLGYAESGNGVEWTRKDDEVGIATSSSGWDSEMICFASMFHASDRTYMFYNGNNHGEGGFGYAVLE